MHGRTFNALTMGQKATVWDDSEFRGRCGVIMNKRGLGNQSLGGGLVVVVFSDGTKHAARYQSVALGDNSHAED